MPNTLAKTVLRFPWKDWEYIRTNFYFLATQLANIWNTDTNLMKIFHC